MKFKKRINTKLLATTAMVLGFGLSGCDVGDELDESTSLNAKYSACTSADSDPDGDGWGWENNQTCKVGSHTPPSSGAHSHFGSHYVDITTFGSFHAASSHTHNHLPGGRTAITTEALVSYNGLRNFLGRGKVDLETVGRWAFANGLTSNDQPTAEHDYKGAGLYFAMQGAKMGWVRDNAYYPQLAADIQRLARQGNTDAVLKLVLANGQHGYLSYLRKYGLVDTFINTLKMEPHYGGWMHAKLHGDFPFYGRWGQRIANSHDVNHLTVLSFDQTQPFMNDKFDYPQWPALEVPDARVIDYFQTFVTLTNPHGEGL